MKSKHGFTLMELLTVIAIIAVLAALLLPTLSRARARAARATCINNLHQINLATRMYADDHQDAIILPSGSSHSSTDFQLYKQFVKSEAGYNGKSSVSEKLFACPSDTFHYSWGRAPGHYYNIGFCQQSSTDFTSYAFNGVNRRSTNYPGIAGRRLTSVHLPARMLLILEAAALIPFSWHKPQKFSGDYRFPDSMNMVSYVDGHVDFVKMYINNNSEAEAWQHDPPAGYDYQWSAD